MAMTAHTAAPGLLSAPARLLPAPGDLFSLEAAFLLFLLSGRYKVIPELQWFPIDFTLLFFCITLISLAWVVFSRRLKPAPLDGPLLAMLAFYGLMLASIFWSSNDSLNVDKLWRSLVLTGSSFLIAVTLARESKRRRRFILLLAWFSVAYLLYYAHYRFLSGVDLVGISLGLSYEDVSIAGPNYLEYGAHANILFVIFVSLAVLGPRRHLPLATIGAGMALLMLLVIGGRGPLAFGLFAVLLLGLTVFFGRKGSMRRLGRLAVFVASLSAAGLAGYMALTVLLPDPGPATRQLHTLQRYELHLSLESTDSMDGRLQAQELAFEKWLEKPVFGWGIGEFRLHHRFEYPHNLLLESLMELGLVGTVLLFSVCAVAILASFRALTSEVPDWIQTALALLFLTDLLSHLTVQGYLADDRIFFMYLGMMVASPDLRRLSRLAPPEGSPASARPPTRRAPARTPLRVSGPPGRSFVPPCEE